jgi:3-deoxy-D-manno-octulosonate 8-phosphate phosphatase (KDO 8-P phosphatase)
MSVDLTGIRLLASDVDGVLTPGTIALDAEGRRLGLFSARDGMGVTLALQAGLEVALVSGADAPAVRARAAELGIRHVRAGVGDKGQALRQLCSELGVPSSAALFVGDDLNDLPAFRAVGVRVAVADAVPEVRGRADWVTAARGGAGAFREIVETVLRAQGLYARTVAALFGTDSPGGS